MSKEMMASPEYLEQLGIDITGINADNIVEIDGKQCRFLGVHDNGYYVFAVAD